MLTDDVTEGEHIEGEQSGTEYRSLGDTAGDKVCLGFCSTQGNVLGAVGEVRLEPVEC